MAYLATDGKPLGWFSKFDAQVYRDLLFKIPEGSEVVEIGTFLGRSYSFVHDIPHKFHLVDTFAGSANDGAGFFVKCLGGNILGAFLDNVKELSLNIPESINVDTSENASKLFDKIDFVFIDADHSYESVKQDIQLWLPKVKKGGIIAGHDYWPNPTPHVAGVKKAVNEFFQPQLFHNSSIWAYYV